MKITKILGIVLIALSIYVGYVGVNKVSNNSNKINLFGLKIDADNESGKEKGYIYLALAVGLFVGGVFTLNKK